MKRTVIISIGGSVIVPTGINVQFLRRFVQYIRRLARSRRVIMVIGGGATARAYLEGARQIGVRLPTALHWIGVRACQLNAELIRAALRITTPVLTDPEAVARSRARVIVVAPPRAGGTSDFRTVIVARRVHAKTVYNVTNVDGVYTADPRRFRDARRLEKITWSKYIRMFGRRVLPGMHVPFDPVAARAAARGRLRVVVLSADLPNVRRALDSQRFRGTTIGPS